MFLIICGFYVCMCLFVFYVNERVCSCDWMCVLAGECLCICVYVCVLMCVFGHMCVRMYVRVCVSTSARIQECKKYIVVTLIQFLQSVSSSA